MSNSELKEWEEELKDIEKSQAQIDTMLFKVTTKYADHPDQGEVLSHLKHAQKFYAKLRTEMHDENI